VKTRVVGAEHPVQNSGGDVIGQHAVVVGRRPRGVLEVRDPRFWLPVPQHPGR